MRQPTKILVTGATGFLGQATLEELDRARIPMVAYLRESSDPSNVCPLGARIARGDITDGASLDAAFASGVDTVIHLVGLIREQGAETYRSVHVEGTRAVVEAAKKYKVAKLVHVSAIGAGTSASTDYHRTKGQADEIVRGSGLPCTILKPSVLFGTGSEVVSALEFTARFPAVSFLPDAGGGRFQPLYVRDAARMILQCVTDPSTDGKTFDIGGPEALTYEQMLTAVERRLGMDKSHVTLLPLFPALAAFVLNFPGIDVLAGFVHRNVIAFPWITAEQLSMLAMDSTARDPNTSGVFTFPLTRFDAWLGTPEFGAVPWRPWHSRWVRPPWTETPETR